MSRPSIPCLLFGLTLAAAVPSCTQPTAGEGDSSAEIPRGPNGARRPARDAVSSIGAVPAMGISTGAPSLDAQPSGPGAARGGYGAEPATAPAAPAAAVAEQRGGGGGRGQDRDAAPAYRGPISKVPKLDRDDAARLERLSQRARPRGADGGAKTRASKDGVRVESGELQFRWNLEPEDGRRLRWIRIEEGDGEVLPFENSWVTPGEGEFRVQRTRTSRGGVVFECSDDIELRVTPHGKSLEIVLEGPPLPEGVVHLGGLRSLLDGFEGFEIVQVPFFDVGHVGVLRRADGSVRYISAWTDPGFSHGSPPWILEAGKVGQQREQQFTQRVLYRTSSEGETRSLRERIWVTYSDSLLDVLPGLDVPAAPLRDEASKYFYLDLHLFPFDQTELALMQLHALGLEDVYVLMREWQRDGYDEGYPTQVLPPRAEWGGAEGLAAVSARAAEYGWPFGLHHNWIFNGEGIEGATMLDDRGEPAARSGGARYLKPAFASALVPDIEGAFKEQFGTTGTYSDSITAIVPPVDLDAAEPDWGLLGHQWLTRAGIIEQLREIHGGPVTAEGSFAFGNLLWAGEVDVINGYVGMVTQAEAKSSLGVAVPAIPHFGLDAVAPKLLHMGIGQPPRYLFPTSRRITLAYGPEQRDHLLAASLLYATAPFHWWIGLSRASECARDYRSIAEPSRLLAQAGRETLEVAYLDREGRVRTLEEMLARGESLLPGQVRLRVRHRLVDGRELTLWANLTPQPLALELEGRGEFEVAPYGHYLTAEGLEAGVLVAGAATLEFCDGDEGLFVDGRGEPVAERGLATDGGAHVQRVGPGRARLTVLPEYAIARTAGESETLVSATHVELSGELLQELLGAAPERVEFTGFPMRAAGRPQELEPLAVQVGADGSLRLEREVWESRTAYTLELVAAGEGE